MATRSKRTHTSGWVIFSGVMLGVAAVTSIIYGFVFLLNDEWIVLTPRAVVAFDLTTAGAIALVLGLIQLFVAFGVFSGELWARVLGIIAASLSIVSQMTFMSVYAQWSWLIIILDGLIIYGLAVHGDEVAEF